MIGQYLNPYGKVLMLRCDGKSRHEAECDRAFLADPTQDAVSDRSFTGVRQLIAAIENYQTLPTPSAHAKLRTRQPNPSYLPDKTLESALTGFAIYPSPSKGLPAPYICLASHLKAIGSVL